MVYLGGKTRISKELAAILNKYLKGLDYYEPFLGGNNILKNLYGYKTAYLSDLHYYLIAYQKARLLTDWTPFLEWDNESKYYDELMPIYNQLKKFIKTGEGSIPTSYLTGEKFSDAFIGYLGFQCSFGGMWYGSFIDRRGYKDAHRNRKPDFYAFRKVARNNNIKIFNLSYNDFNPNNSLIYCDPPYLDTAKYSEGINHTDFWNWCRERSKNNLVFISEETAPDDFISILDIPILRSLNTKSDNQKTIYERLFIHRSLLSKIKIDKQLTLF